MCRGKSSKKNSVYSEHFCTTLARSVKLNLGIAAPLTACPRTRNFDACGNGDEQQALKTDSSSPSTRSTKSSKEYSELQPKADDTSACCRSPSTTVVCP